KKGHGRNSLEGVGAAAANQAYDSHDCTENEPARTPRQWKIYFAEVIGIERGVIIGVAIRREKRRITLESRKTQAEIVSETVRNSPRAEYAKFVGELGVNRVNVVIEIDAEGAAESCAAQPNAKGERSAKRQEERSESKDSIHRRTCRSEKCGE